MDGWTDGWPDRWTDGQTDLLTVWSVRITKVETSKNNQVLRRLTS